jgi:hypothetical protein
MVNWEHGTGRRFVRVVQGAHEWLHFYLSMGVNRREKLGNGEKWNRFKGMGGVWRFEVGNWKFEKKSEAGKEGRG